MDSRPLILTVLLGCAGPQPSVHGAQAVPSPQPGATRVSFDLVNDGGKGSVQIDIVLRGSGTEIRADRTLDVEAHRTVHYETDVETPPGTYAVTASAEFPD